MPHRNLVTMLGLAGLLAAAAAAQTKINNVVPKDVSPVNGKAMFMEYCAACHGPEGKGNGPAAPALKKAPADLTQLSTHNNGKFPDVRVSRYIEGVDTVQAHGTRDMPVWGDIFKSLNANSAAPTMRVSNLTAYVKSIQAK
jgi:mono/diheme cytochrome c family protein